MKVTHDCFGVVLVVEGAQIKFICQLCNKAYQVLDGEGLHNISPHAGKHKNTTPRASLRYALDKMDEIEKNKGRTC